MEINHLLTIILLLIIVVIFTTIYLIQILKSKNNSTNDIVVSQKIDDIRNSIENVKTSFGNMSVNVTRDMASALTRVDEKVGVFNSQVETLNKSQENFSRILSGVKQYGVLAEFSLAALIKDLLPSSQYILNYKPNPEETKDIVEFGIILQNGIVCCVDSHWPIEKYKAIDDAFTNKDKDALAIAKDELAKAFRDKAKSVSSKYISPPKTTDFAIVYAPTEGLFSELASYQDPKTKELLTQELMKKYKVTLMGPNTLSAYLQALHMGFQSLRVQKHATEVHDALKLISQRFEQHFSGVTGLRKKLEEAMKYTDDFGRDARSIMRTIENLKDPQNEKDNNVERLKVIDNK